MPPRIRNDFFKTWSEEMAYCLGFWWADGCMYQQKKGGCVVIFASIDLDHLQQLQNIICAGNIYTLYKTDRRSYQLTIGRKDMFEDLYQLGGRPKKSETTIWPRIPDEFLRHFARGYIDGDGSLFWHQNKYPMPRITACGTESFLSGLVQSIEQQTGIPNPRVFPANRKNFLMQTNWNGISAKCLAGWLYEDCTVSLLRKKELAREFLQWIPRIYHPSLVTDFMQQKFAQYLPCEKG